MQVFNFVVLSLIIAPQNVLTPDISITLNVRELELMLKRPVKKKEALPSWGFIEQSSLFS